jgi:uncharacterized membrane protein YgaE (UPF0421/DUF939 family)
MRTQSRPTSILRGIREGAARRGLTRPARESLWIVSRRAQPATLTILRLTFIAIVAFELARRVTGNPRPILAPLTALLVVQVTLFQTIRTALQRVASVVAGVLVALGLSSWLGFTWYSLALTIAAALTVGYMLRLGDSVLEVPISAMLILSLPTENEGLGRIVATLIGAATGLVLNLIMAPLHVQSAEEAVEDLGRRLADLLDQMATDLEEGHAIQQRHTWVDHARALTEELERVEDTLDQAEDSVRLNPRSMAVIDPRVYLRRRLETLERVTLTLRGVARSLEDTAGLAEQVDPVRDPAAAYPVAGVLRELAGALRSYGRLALSKSVDRTALKADVDRRLAEAAERQRVIAETLHVNTADPESGWRLRGELVNHLERLRFELYPSPPQPQTLAGAAQPATWRHPIRAVAGRWRRGIRSGGGA